MSILTKIRGLWRFDGDTEPVKVSRRSFIFMGGVVAAGAILPALNILPVDSSLVTVYGGALGGGKTAMGIRLEREARLRLLKLKVMMQDHGQPFGGNGEWLMSPRAYRELTKLDPERLA